MSSGGIQASSHPLLQTAKIVKIIPLGLSLILIGVAHSGFASPPPMHWTFEDVKQVGGVAPTVWGAPRIMADGAIHFDGKADGLMLPENPIAGWPKFTIAVLFRPESDAPVAQRFFCIEDRNAGRLTMETRIVNGKTWCMDTFLLAGSSKRTLIDMSKLHPLDAWAWAELVYDGREMTSYVDGAQELTGEVTFPPMVAGNTSVGVRLNRVFWYKGLIREVRFYPAALGPDELPRVGP
jgi:hypothetical protein